MVKCTLFQSYCLSMYDVALRHKYTSTCINKLRSCYNKCIKIILWISPQTESYPGSYGDRLTKL